jgi:hypothetical protein
MVDRSDFIVFVDESGTPMTHKVDKSFPVFSLQFLIIRKSDYVRQVVSELTKFKLDFHGSDSVILRGSNIRARDGDFSLLNDRDLAETYYVELDKIISAVPMRLVSGYYLHSDIKLVEGITISKPYSRFMHRLLEEITPIISPDGKNVVCRVVIESRHEEDEELLSSLENYKILFPESPVHFEIEMVHKERNVLGLQLVDLVAQPVAKSCLPNSAPSKPWLTIEPKVIAKLDLIQLLEFRLGEGPLA